MDAPRRLTDYKFLILLAVIFPITYLAPDVLVYRLVSIHGIEITGAIFIFIFSFFLGDVITEIYGYEVMRHIIWCSIIADFIFTAVISIIIHLPSPAHWHQNAAYQTVLGSSFRSTLSDVAIPIGLFVNSLLLSKWKILVRGRYFWIRSVTSSLIGEFVESIFTYIIIFAGIESPREIFHLFLAGLAAKIIWSLVAAFPTAWLVRGLKRWEGMDAYDYGVDFNPFKFAIEGKAKNDRESDET